MDSINKLINFGLNQVANIIQNVDPKIINNIIESSASAIKNHKENTEIMINVASSFLQTGNKVAKEIIEGTINFNNDNMINFIQVIIKQMLPINIDIKDIIDKKQIVVNEGEINKYLSLKLGKIDDIKNFNLSIFKDNLIEINFDISKFLDASVSQRFHIQEFVINPKEAYLNLEITDEMSIKGNNFISKIIVYIIQLLFKNFFKNQIISQLNKHDIQVIDSIAKIDLKKEILSNLYLINLSSIVDKHLDPIIDELVSNALKIFLKDKKVFDLAQIISIKTEKEKLLIDFKVNLPYLG